MGRLRDSYTPLVPRSGDFLLTYTVQNRNEICAELALLAPFCHTHQASVYSSSGTFLNVAVDRNQQGREQHDTGASDRHWSHMHARWITQRHLPRLCQPFERRWTEHPVYSRKDYYQTT